MGSLLSCFSYKTNDQRPLFNRIFGGVVKKQYGPLQVEDLDYDTDCDELSERDLLEQMTHELEDETRQSTDGGADSNHDHPIDGQKRFVPQNC